MNAETIREILKDEGINMIFEDLRERHFSGEDYIISNEEFMPAIKKMFDDPNYALPGGESNTVCQNRSVVVLKNIIEEYKGKKVAIGTHGNVMTLMMNYFDSNYGLDFLNQTKKPDIYKMHFKDLVLEEVTKLWKE